MCFLDVRTLLDCYKRRHAVFVSVWDINLLLQNSRFSRYYVLCKDKHGYFRKFALIYASCCVLIGVQSVLGLFCFETNEGDPKYLMELKQNGLFSEDTPPFSVVDAVSCVRCS
jgi:hypothetical protein